MTEVPGVSSLFSPPLVGRLVTPNSLLQRPVLRPSEPLNSQTVTFETTTLQLPQAVRPRARKASAESAVPEFALQFLQQLPKQTYKVSARIDNSRPVTHRKPRVHWSAPPAVVPAPELTAPHLLNARDRSRKQETRLYRPQLLQISPRSKLTLYCPYSIAGTQPSRRMKRTSYAVPQIPQEQTAEEEQGLAANPSEPAVTKASMPVSDTYGQKLLIMTELCPVGWFN